MMALWACVSVAVAMVLVAFVMIRVRRARIRHAWQESERIKNEWARWVVSSQEQHWRAEQEAAWKRALAAEDERRRQEAGWVEAQIVWRGETREQLIASFGDPHASEEKELASKSREVLKYYPRGNKRYALRVTLDDGVVVQWDDKR